jgi:hypothetical protein
MCGIVQTAFDPGAKLFLSMIPARCEPEVEIKLCQPPAGEAGFDLSMMSMHAPDLKRLLKKETVMNIEPVLALIIGILILIMPRFLNYFVAVYLIVVGVLGLMNR